MENLLYALGFLGLGSTDFRLKICGVKFC